MASRILELKRVNRYIEKASFEQLCKHSQCHEKNLNMKLSGQTHWIVLSADSQGSSLGQPRSDGKPSSGLSSREGSTKINKRAGLWGGRQEMEQELNNAQHIWLCPQLAIFSLCLGFQINMFFCCCSVKFFSCLFICLNVYLILILCGH